MSYDPGDVWAPQLKVYDANGALTDATVALATSSPTGVAGAPTVVRDSLGTYSSSLPLNEVGRWTATWTVSGAVTGVEQQDAYVRRLGSNVIPLADVKAALDKSSAVRLADAQIERMLDAAIAEYELYIGPVSGSVTEKYDGGRATIVLRSPNVSQITAAVYSDGTTIDVSTLDLDTATGIVGWGVNTAGTFTRGTRNVTITYTVGSLPANHREAIIADVAGYFAATQRGPLGVPGQGYEAGFAAAPLVMFPRIRALAIPSVA